MELTAGFITPFPMRRLRSRLKMSTSLPLLSMRTRAPYGTGIFLIKKGYIQQVNTQEAKYVAGEDNTIIGSRSGANAIAAWMILVKNGPFGWQEKVFILKKRTEWMCNQLRLLCVDYYRHPFSNIITIHSGFVNEQTVALFGLVPDDHKSPEWYKIVIMEHVTIEKLMLLIEDLNADLPEKI
jgi:glutamate/tyrosine decarboxylase-like PLP-dependent enzyme